jgi:hypothetical protein
VTRPSSGNPRVKITTQIAAKQAEAPCTRRTVLGGLSAIAANTFLSGCGQSDSLPPIISPNTQPIPSGPLVAVSVVVTEVIAGTIGPRFAGLSYEKTSMALPRFTPQNVDLIRLFRRLGPSLLRIGGYYVDFVNWAPNGAGLTAGEVAPSDIDALAAFADATDWSVLYSVNLAKSTPAAAAAEVAYAAQALGNRLSGVELGNECNSYGELNFFPTWNLQIFEQLWGEFRAAILQTTPNVVMTGPASIGAINNWTLPFAADVGSQQIALLTQHYYRGSGLSPSSTAANLISPDSNLIGDLQLLQTASESLGIPFRISETNSYFGGGAIGVSNSYASALWVVDFLFDNALGGSSGVNLHGGGDKPGYTPIADDDGYVTDVRPEYYGVLLFTLAGQGRLLLTAVSASGLNVTAYAVLSAQGGLNIVLINKEETQSLEVSIDCGRPVYAADLTAMTGPSLLATTGVAIQGASIAPDGGFSPGTAYTLAAFGNTVSCYIGALSAAVVRITLF